ncbi:TPA: sucrose-6-phosphate hydrolase [Escherichia coli]|uniref:sucrose-6-phosphate hydrolase n=1 Tax=Escherichia coli TaxID=562 RepID=UPI00128D6D91|nr:sucrose-6-phosphate hydrolase [Escherichia coli]EFL3018117.1 sucrose-6-phosphate hydrolase [Escherichia coli]EJE7038826.1 sucrose-6-phosphate hydrolase [Escherichia coli]ELR0767942.1 sucrose-6-phosphate hydrolase [Escherichia coli]ELW2164069.1 sucrose-6-phosphate hydrolase [Escherichia coli]ELX1413063.1 sucrose-6-phosphate hydrolase [Escherichia coli]
MSMPSQMPAILQAVMKGQSKALADAHYPCWHLAPVTGLMNDPNGFCWSGGRYHLFYQWNPLACDHKYKCWGHWSSTDLLHWQHEPLALMPDKEYDRNGCYSGSAVNNQGVLTLCYTGNVKFDDGSRTAWQCLATENNQGGFDKLGPVIPLPDGYTGHVRDPKVWKHNSQWYMVLGAQDKEKRGKVLLYSSVDLYTWSFHGEIAGNGLNEIDNAGYMWECPDLFALDGEYILLCCPQGMAREHERYLNTYPCAWLHGQFDYETGKFTHGAFSELDAGFEFYAPQTMEAPDGRRLLVGWMGVPDGEEMLQPTRKHHWQHQMTCFRELSFQKGKLFQMPIRELAQLREAEHFWQGKADHAPHVEIERLEMDIIPSGELYLNFGNALVLHLNDDGIQLQRRSLAGQEKLTRYWRGSVTSLKILCDSSSVEIFINNGEGVMSNRYFPHHPASLILQGESDVTLRYWSLRACMVE